MNLKPHQKAVGKCPKCGRTPTWFNDVPLRAFCNGTDKKEHAEMTCIVPPPTNPYIYEGEKWPKGAFKWKTEKQYQALMEKVS